MGLSNRPNGPSLEARGKRLRSGKACMPGPYGGLDCPVFGPPYNRAAECHDPSRAPWLRRRWPPAPRPAPLYFGASRVSDASTPPGSGERRELDGPASWPSPSWSGWWQVSSGSFWRSSAMYRWVAPGSRSHSPSSRRLPALLFLRSAARPKALRGPERESGNCLAPIDDLARNQPGGGPRARTLRCPDLGSRSVGAGHRRVVAGRRGGDRPRACGGPLLDPARPARRHPDRAVASDGLAPVEAGRRLAVSNLAVKRRQTMAIENVETAPELDDVLLEGREALLSLGSRAVLAVPIVIFDELIGVLALHRTTPGRWGDDEIALTEAVAREIGLAVRVAQLLRENEQRMTEQGSLFRIAAHLSESLSLADTLEALAQAARDAPRHVLRRPDASRGDARADRRGRPAGGACSGARRPVAGLCDCLRDAAEEARPLASPDITGDDRFGAVAGTCKGAGYHSLLAVPVESPRAERCGLVVVFFARERIFTDEDLDVARNLGDAASGALERASCSRPSARRARYRSSWRAPGACWRRSSIQPPSSTRSCSRRRSCSRPTRAPCARSRRKTSSSQPRR